MNNRKIHRKSEDFLYCVLTKSSNKDLWRPMGNWESLLGKFWSNHYKTEKLYILVIIWCKFKFFKIRFNCVIIESLNHFHRGPTLMDFPWWYIQHQLLLKKSLVMNKGIWGSYDVSECLVNICRNLNSLSVLIKQPLLFW